MAVKSTKKRKSIMEITKKPHYIDVHVGGKVRLRRMLAGMSQEQLGNKLGLTFQQIQKYEKGTNRVSASRLWEMSKVLNVPIQYFFEDVLSDETSDSDTSGEVSRGFSETGQSEIMNFVGSTEGINLNKSFIGIQDQNVRKKVSDLVKALNASQDDQQ